ncbi:MAG: hypothetical protein ACXVIP_05585 [Halobacteriota archaeon]
MQVLNELEGQKAGDLAGCGAGSVGFGRLSKPGEPSRSGGRRFESAGPICF